MQPTAAIFLLAACLCAMSPAIAGGEGPVEVPVTVYLTNPGLVSAALTREPDVELTQAPVASEHRVIDVNDSVHYQSILGFGVTMSDSSDWLINTQLATAQKQALLDALFSPTDGIGLNFIKVPIGASDFTVGGIPYTYDDQPPDETDPTLQDFSIAHDLPYVIPVLQQMRAVNPDIDFYATSWSAPAWMKGNDALNSIGNSARLLPQYYEAYAKYFADFIKAYQSDGIPIWGLAPQNEPYAHVEYPGMILTGSQEANLIQQDIAPTFAQDAIHTRIYTDQQDIADDQFDAQVRSATVGGLTAGVDWHCYHGGYVISDFHAAVPDTQNLLTECATYLSEYSPSEAAIDDLRNGASTFLLWSAVVDQDGGPVNPSSSCGHCGGLATVDDNQLTEPDPTFMRSYYELGQFSKFIQRGAVRIETPRWVQDVTSATPPPAQVGIRVTAGTDNVAFRNPNGTRVLVVYDHSKHSRRFGVEWHRLRFDYTLRAGATVTFIWQGAVPERSPCVNAGVDYESIANPETGAHSLRAEPDCRRS